MLVELSSSLHIPTTISQDIANKETHNYTDCTKLRSVHNCGTKYKGLSPLPYQATAPSWSVPSEHWALILVYSKDPDSMELWQFWDENTQKRCCVYHKMCCVVFCVKAGEKISAKQRKTSVTFQNQYRLL